MYESNEDACFKTRVSDDTCFRKDKDKTINIIQREKTRYNCRIILQIQSVFYINKDNKDDIVYHAQVFSQDCRYTLQINKILICDAVDFTDTDPESESEEEFNDTTE